MDAMDIAALSVVTRQAYTQQQASYTVMRMAMDSVNVQAQGVAEMAQTIDAQQLAQVTGIGRYLDVTV